MKKIYKYEVPKTAWYQDVYMELPLGELLHIQRQNDTIQVWVLVYDIKDSTTALHPIRVYGTGWEITTELPYFSTIQEGGYIWHVFTEKVVKETQ
jgi:hypothetical protein